MDIAARSLPASQLRVPVPDAGQASTGSFLIHDAHDIICLRRVIHELAIAGRLPVAKRTRLVAAASELARNILKFAGRGTVAGALLRRPAGIRLVFSDEGPGIADLKLAMLDGWSSVGALGLGLPSARRLVDQFSIESNPHRGTRVTIVMWRR